MGSARPLSPGYTCCCVTPYACALSLVKRKESKEMAKDAETGMSDAKRLTDGKLRFRLIFPHANITTAAA